MTQRGRTLADLAAENKIATAIIIIVSIVILLYIIAQDIPVKVGPVEVGTKNSTKDTVSKNGNVDIKGNNNINGNNNNIYQLQQNQSEDNYQYSLIGTSSQSLINRLTYSKKLKFVPNSKKYIQITHTGKIVHLSGGNETYYYTGGNIKLIVNDNCSFEFYDLKIDEMRPNSKEAINQEIDKRIDHYINLNVQRFSNQILKCIPN